MIDIADPSCDPDFWFVEVYDEFGESFTDDNVYMFFKRVHLRKCREFGDGEFRQDVVRQLMDLSESMMLIWINAGYAWMTKPVNTSPEEALADPLAYILCEVTNEGRALWRKHEKLSKSQQKSQKSKKARVHTSS